MSSETLWGIQLVRWGLIADGDEVGDVEDGSEGDREGDSLGVKLVGLREGDGVEEGAIEGDVVIGEGVSDGDDVSFMVGEEDGASEGDVVG